MEKLNEIRAEQIDDPLSYLDYIIPPDAGYWVSDISNIDFYRGQKFSTISFDHLYEFLRDSNKALSETITFRAINDELIVSMLNEIIKSRDDGKIKLSHYSMAKAFQFTNKALAGREHEFAVSSKTKIIKIMVSRALRADPEVIYLGGHQPPVKNPNYKKQNVEPWVNPDQHQLSLFFNCALTEMNRLFQRAKSEPALLSSLITSNIQGGYLDPLDLFDHLRGHGLTEGQILKFSPSHLRRQVLDESFDI